MWYQLTRKGLSQRDVGTQPMQLVCRLVKRTPTSREDITKLLETSKTLAEEVMLYHRARRDYDNVRVYQDCLENYAWMSMFLDDLLEHAITEGNLKEVSRDMYKT